MAAQPAPHPAGTALPAADARGNSPDGPAGRWLDGVFYPASDGQPMADNSWQAEAMMTAAMDLHTHYPRAFVTTDMLLYYERGVVDRRTAPDVLVAFDVGSDHRSSYVVWEEGKPPDWVLEVASRSTVDKDVYEKADIYQALLVPEYWLFDPEGDVLPAGQPRLQGRRLCHGEYVPIQPWIEGGRRLLRSEALGLDVRAEGKLLRFRDPVTGEDLLHQDEEKARGDREAAARQAETVRADQETVRADQETVRADQETVRADQEAAARQAETARADREAAARMAETRRANEAQARVAELEAANRRLRGEA